MKRTGGECGASAVEYALLLALVALAALAATALFGSGVAALFRLPQGI